MYHPILAFPFQILSGKFHAILTCVEYKPFWNNSFLVHLALIVSHFWPQYLRRYHPI